MAGLERVFERAHKVVAEADVEGHRHVLEEEEHHLVCVAEGVSRLEPVLSIHLLDQIQTNRESLLFDTYKPNVVQLNK